MNISNIPAPYLFHYPMHVHIDSRNRRRRLSDQVRLFLGRQAGRQGTNKQWRVRACVVHTFCMSNLEGRLDYYFTFFLFARTYAHPRHVTVLFQLARPCFRACMHKCLYMQFFLCMVACCCVDSDSDEPERKEERGDSIYI